MPVDKNGRWVSRATLNDQKAAEVAAPAEDIIEEPVAEATQPRRSRRSKSAAEAAIKAATGQTIDITDELDIEVLEDLEDIIEENTDE